MSSQFFKTSIIEDYKAKLKDEYIIENYNLFNFESLNAYVNRLYERIGLNDKNKKKMIENAKQTIKTELIKFMCKNAFICKNEFICKNALFTNIIRLLFGEAGTSKYDILILAKKYEYQLQQRQKSKRICDFFDNIRGILIVELDTYSIKVLCYKQTEAKIDYKQILSDAYDYTIEKKPTIKNNNQEEDEHKEYEADFEDEYEDDFEDEGDEDDKYKYDKFEEEDDKYKGTIEDIRKRYPPVTGVKRKPKDADGGKRKRRPKTKRTKHTKRPKRKTRKYHRR